MSRLVARLLLCTAVVTGVVGVQTASADPDPNQGTLSGTVTDATTGNGIPNITVTVDLVADLEATTNASGNYTIANIPTGESPVDVDFVDENAARITARNDYRAAARTTSSWARMSTTSTSS